MKKKTIGILTFWSVPNYGAFAQAYALNQLIAKMKPSCHVEHIGYLHPKHQDLYFPIIKREKPPFLRWWDIINPYYYQRVFQYAVDSLKKERYESPHFKKDWTSIPHIDIRSSKELELRKWDTIITGSDCIWEYSIKDFGDDVHLIGNRLRCRKLIAYAASFGDMNPDDVFPHFVKNGLLRYDYISVRDQTSLDIIQSQGVRRKDIPIVLDPTLLYDFKSDVNIPKSKLTDYILVYGYQFFDDTEQQVKEYAKKNNLTVLGAGLAPDWCDIVLKDISPLEWIGLFNDADFVVTSTFHGLMFSIKYEKRIMFNQVGYVKNRSSWLLEQLGIAELYRSGNNLEYILNYDWDYAAINLKLEELSGPSLAYLREALDCE